MANITRRTAAPEAAIWDPFRRMRELFEDVESRALEPMMREFTPRFDVKETKDSYMFKADLPGVKEQDVDVSVTGNRLTVSGKRDEERTEEGERYYAYERSYGSFSRAFTLPEGVDADAVRAELKNGVLTIRIPKRPEVQPRRITVQGEGMGEAKKGAKA